MGGGVGPGVGACVGALLTLGAGVGTAVCAWVGDADADSTELGVGVLETPGLRGRIFHGRRRGAERSKRGVMSK